MTIIQKIRRHGVAGSARKACELTVRKTGWHALRTRHAPRYVAPDPAELAEIEDDLKALGIAVEDYVVDPAAFGAFQSEGYFPADYHGGTDGPVWDEKLLEHFIGADLLDLFRYGPDDTYVDIAAASSPWAYSLRQRIDIQAYAIDLIRIPPAYSELPYYRREDATRSSFAASSVRGASLHCAFEMFAGDHDVELVKEAGRILAPGGKVVIVPLYMHTHPCAYATREFWGKGWSDPDATEYVRADTYGVRSSRKYDARKLKARVLDTAGEAGLTYRVLALRNPRALGANIYCHFILELSK